MNENKITPTQFVKDNLPDYKERYANAVTRKHPPHHSMQLLMAEREFVNANFHEAFAVYRHGIYIQANEEINQLHEATESLIHSIETHVPLKMPDPPVSEQMTKRALSEIAANRIESMIKKYNFSEISNGLQQELIDALLKDFQSVMYEPPKTDDNIGPRSNKYNKTP